MYIPDARHLPNQYIYIYIIFYSLLLNTRELIKKYSESPSIASLRDVIWYCR